MKKKSFGVMILAMSLVILGCPDPAGDIGGAATKDYFSSTIGILKYVPGGTFQRDATPTNISVITEPFRMSQCEITRLQFYTIMGTDPSNPVCSSGESDPVQVVNWYHAIAFCNKLSIAEGFTPAYSVTVGGTPIDFGTLAYASIPTGSNAEWNAASANWSVDGYRLPTEMEWMWAAMGADTANPGQVNYGGYAKLFAGYTGSNLIDDYAWYFNNSSDRTHPVGTTLPNELGLYDMSGNVLEWCWDWYNLLYPTGAATDYRGAASGTIRIMRGGCRSMDMPFCTVAKRWSAEPEGVASITGFRVVRP